MTNTSVTTPKTTIAIWAVRRSVNAAIACSADTMGPRP
jgi:hypothetical protein